MRRAARSVVGNGGGKACFGEDMVGVIGGGGWVGGLWSGG